MATILTLFADAAGAANQAPPPDAFWHFYSTNLCESVQRVPDLDRLPLRRQNIHSYKYEEGIV